MRLAPDDEQAAPTGHGLGARLAQRVELTPAPDERDSHEVHSNERERTAMVPDCARGRLAITGGS